MKNSTSSDTGKSVSNENVGEVHSDGASNASLLLNWWVCLLVFVLAITFGCTCYHIKELKNDVLTLENGLSNAVTKLEGEIIKWNHDWLRSESNYARDKPKMNEEIKELKEIVNTLKHYRYQMEISIIQMNMVFLTVSEWKISAVMYDIKPVISILKTNHYEDKMNAVRKLLSFLATKEVPFYFINENKKDDSLTQEEEWVRDFFPDNTPLFIAKESISTTIEGFENESFVLCWSAVSTVNIPDVLRYPISKDEMGLIIDMEEIGRIVDIVLIEDDLTN